MKILTSYFYQIRFFKPNIIPLSTCLSDPVWYHKGNGKSFYYKDKNDDIFKCTDHHFSNHSQEYISEIV